MTAASAEARVAELEREVAALRAENEALRSASVHDQGGWHSPFDPVARVAG